MRSNIQKQMEEITENHPNTEMGEEWDGEHIPIITQRKREDRRDGQREGVNKFGSCLNRRTSP